MAAFEQSIFVFSFRNMKRHGLHVAHSSIHILLSKDEPLFKQYFEVRTVECGPQKLA